MSVHSPDLPLFSYGLRVITEAAARAAYEWIGMGDKNAGDHAAVEAMRAELNLLPIDGVVVIGEGAKDEAPELYNGEQIGDPSHAPKFDIAVDPVEGTTYLASGLSNSLAVIAMAPRGSMMNPGPAFYMEKFAGPPAVKGKIDPDSPIEEKLRILSRELGKPIRELRAYVLDKPRHENLVARINKTGARVALYSAGDIAGALLAADPESEIDCLVGTGGTPEGIISACAIRGLGGEFLGRLDPQKDDEKRAVAEAGLDTSRWYRAEELVTSEKVFFCATGITDGLLVQGVHRNAEYDRTQTLIITGTTRERQTLTTWHKR
ncbi:MAG TPA: class II fructose-bisphosphatase [Azospirillaceae bacterium]|nr:class II fructose-bisphosphatase [Azospirillaceae bacterium]